ncbi:MAG: helix-turn-helix transcriptional regulator [Hespellia sp.]|nr:helix-turn-helix transcriptional regulator [Hespellia sp.]
MATGQRIKYFRNKLGLTQKKLGELLGFLGKTSDVRMAQYESEARVPKDDLIKKMATIFDVNSRALTVPDIDSYVGLMHTFFALEDMYGLKIGEIDGELCLRLDKSNTSEYANLFDMFHAWQVEAAKLESGEITLEEYDDWRYQYPSKDTSQIMAKVPSQDLSDYLVEAFLKKDKKRFKKD